LSGRINGSFSLVITPLREISPLEAHTANPIDSMSFAEPKTAFDAVQMGDRLAVLLPVVTVDDEECPAVERDEAIPS